MTYSPEHVTGAHRLAQLLDTLDQDVSDLRRMLTIYGDVHDLPSRRGGGGHDGRQATHDPSRPTETIALDEGRAALRAAVDRGSPRVAQAVALVRGTTAEMDRALGEWEGADPPGIMGAVHGHNHGTAEYPDAA